jgi:hypothetical protein
MGDRFVLVRVDSTVGRLAAGRRATRNTGNERLMRAELAAAADAVLESADVGAPVSPSEDEAERLLLAADLVTRARTGVEFDRGAVEFVHAPEAPTRFAKQLTQLFRGGVAIGMTRADALALALRCARDSMPPLRLSILEVVAAEPGSTGRQVSLRIRGAGRSTVYRWIDALSAMGLIVDQVAEGDQAAEGVMPGAATSSRWVLAEDVDLSVLDPGRC